MLVELNAAIGAPVTVAYPSPTCQGFTNRRQEAGGDAPSSRRANGSSAPVELRQAPRRARLGPRPAPGPVGTGAARDLAFFFCGLGPGFADGVDTFWLQWLGEALDTSRLQRETAHRVHRARPSSGIKRDSLGRGFARRRSRANFLRQAKQLVVKATVRGLHASQPWLLCSRTVPSSITYPSARCAELSKWRTLLSPNPPQPTGVTRASEFSAGVCSMNSTKRSGASFTKRWKI